MKMSGQEFLVIGNTDYYSVCLIREWDYITLKRMTEKTYEEMEEYIRDNWDLESEWRDSVYNWNTEQWFDSWLEEYDYYYWDYFQYDNVVDMYYDEQDNDYLCDDFNTHSYSSKEDCIDDVMGYFDEYYNTSNLEFSDIWYNELRDKISEYYDKVIAYQKEREERSEPHWQAFSYYK